MAEGERMNKRLIAAVIAGLFAAPAVAQQVDEPFRIRGSGSLGAIYTNSSSQDISKFDEYRDLSNGLLSNVFIQGTNNRTWFEGYGENFGRDDQYMYLRGGMYGLFKYGIYSNSIPHDLGVGLRTPFNGSGTNLQTAIFPQTDPGTWNTFDLGYKRVNNSGYLEWQGYSPWYVRFDGSQVKWDGSKMGSAALGTSPGNGFADLAFPVEYTSRNVSVEGGYQTSAMTFSISWLYSQFDNDNHTLNWSNPFFGNKLDATQLAPDNSYNKFTATGTYRALPWNSTLSARYTWAKTTSDVDLAAQQLSITTGTTVSAYLPTNPNVSTFNGEHVDQTFQLAWTAIPVANVDTRVYYFWTKKENNSTEVVFTPAATSNLLCAGAPCAPELFSYRKNNAGVDAWWRCAKGQRLGAGWDYVDLDVERPDYSSSKDNKFWIEYKNTMIADLAARLKYTYINRDSNFLLGNEGTGPADPAYLERFISRFDLQDLHSNQGKLMLDWSPMPLVGVSFEGIWKKNDYESVTFGRTTDKRDEYYLQVSYGDPSRWQVTAFGDLENIRYDSNHRQIGTLTAANANDPNAPPTSTNFNWSAQNKDQNWAVGVGLTWPINEQWMVKGSYIYYDTNGSADIQSQNNFGNPLPINQYDDTRRHSVNLKGTYQMNRNWSFTAGYAYEKYDYSDAAYNGYQYTIPFPAVSNNTSQSYLNGFHAFQNYTANIVYGLATYRF
jgi:MtrB/PioB family decaheme-associated outer membrane protein